MNDHETQDRAIEDRIIDRAIDTTMQHADPALRAAFLNGWHSALEGCAAEFDHRATDAAAGPRADRDIDAALAWSSAARWIRGHAGKRFNGNAQPTSGAAGTPADPSVPGYAHAYTVTFDGDTHWLACDFCESPISPIEAADSLDEIVTRARDHERVCSATTWPVGRPWTDSYQRLVLGARPATSPTGDPTDAG